MATTCACASAAVLFRDVRTIVPGVTDDVVNMELYNTLKEFCRRSLAVRADTEDTLQAGTGDFMMADAEGGWEVIHVLSLRNEDQWLRPRPILRQAQPVAAQAGYWCSPPNHVRFSTPFIKQVTINGVVALGPGVSCATNCQTVPKVVWDEHYEAIRAGTLGRLYMQPAKPYSNLAQGRLMMARAHSLTGEARVMADKANTMADPPWVYPRFAV